MNPLTGRQQGEGCELRAECSQSREGKTARITSRMHECENGEEEQKEKKTNAIASTTATTYDITNNSNNKTIISFSTIIKCVGFTYYCSLSLFLSLFSPLYLAFLIIPLVLLPLQLFMLVFFIAVIPMRKKTHKFCHKCNHALIFYSIRSLEWCLEMARSQRTKFHFFPERIRQTNALIRCLLTAQKVTALIGGTLEGTCQE